MASIPLPALAVRPPEDPSANIVRAVQLKSMLNAQQREQALLPGQIQAQKNTLEAQQQENAQRAQQIKDAQAMTAAYKAWDGKDPADLGKMVIENGGSGNARVAVEQHYLGLKKNYSDIAKADAETGSKNLEIVKQKNDMTLGAINAAEGVPDEQLADHLDAAISGLTQKGFIDQQHAQVGSQLIQGLRAGQIDAKTARAQLDLYKKDLMSNSQQIEQSQKEATLAKTKSETNKINAEIDPNNPVNPEFQKQKYMKILQDIQEGGLGNVKPNDFKWAQSYELSQRKSENSSQRDSLGITQTSAHTTQPTGLAGATQGSKKGPASAPPQSGTTINNNAGGNQQNLRDSLVDEIGQYKLNPQMLSRMMLKHPEIIAQVNQKYPDWNQSQYNAINKAVVDLAPSGKTGQQITSYNTFLRHAGALYDAVDSLDNSKYSDLLNKPLNWLAQHTGDQRVADFMAAMQPPMKEFQSFLLNNHAMHTEDVKDAHDLIDVNKTPQEIRAVLKRFAETGSARLSEQNESFKRITGKDIPNLVSPQAAAAYNKITGEQAPQLSKPQPRNDGKFHPSFTPINQ